MHGEFVRRARRLNHGTTCYDHEEARVARPIRTTRKLLWTLLITRPILFDRFTRHFIPHIDNKTTNLSLKQFMGEKLFLLTYSSMKTTTATNDKTCPSRGPRASQNIRNKTNKFTSLFLSFFLCCFLSVPLFRSFAHRARWFACRLAFSSSRRGKMRSYMYTCIPAHVTLATCVDVTHNTYMHIYIGLCSIQPRPRLDSTAAAGMRRDATRHDVREPDGTVIRIPSTESSIDRGTEHGGS